MIVLSSLRQLNKFPKLLDQLKVNGFMVIPVGTVLFFQTLLRLTKGADGRIKQENLGIVAFVPLTVEYGQG